MLMRGNGEEGAGGGGDSVRGGGRARRAVVKDLGNAVGGVSGVHVRWKASVVAEMAQNALAGSDRKVECPAGQEGQQW